MNEAIFWETGDRYADGMTLSFVSTPFLIACRGCRVQTVPTQVQFVQECGSKMSGGLLLPVPVSPTPAPPFNSVKSPACSNVVGTVNEAGVFE